MSFFCDVDTHVVTRAKEALIERPHGTILIGHADTESMREVLGDHRLHVWRLCCADRLWEHLVS
jgi:hypothetical protein